MRETSNLYVRTSQGRAIEKHGKRLVVRLNAQERQTFADLRRIGKRLLAADDITPARWIRWKTIEADVAKITISLARGWRDFGGDYPIAAEVRKLQNDKSKSPGVQFAATAAGRELDVILAELERIDRQIDGREPVPNSLF